MSVISRRRVFLYYVLFPFQQSEHTGRDSFASALCADKCSAPLSRRRQQSPGLLHLIVRVPFRPEGETNKRDTLAGIPFIRLVHKMQ